jgi:serine protease Do
MRSIAGCCCERRCREPRVCLSRKSSVVVLAAVLLTGAFAANAAAQEPLQTAGLPTATAAAGTTAATATILDEAGRQLARVAATVKHTVVHIESRRSGRNGAVEETGSGVVMTSQRFGGLFVVTNRHVIAGAGTKNIKIRLQDGTIVNPTNVIEDEATDIAVLRLAGANLATARWGDSDSLDIGHMVIAVGSPFGLSQSVTLGIISAKGRRSLVLTDNAYDVINQDFLQTDAAINPGNSGGPLVDLMGRIVGINTAIASQGGGNEGIGFSIPSNLARYVVDQLLEHGRVRRGYLGVRLDEEFDEQAALRFNLDRERGAHVLQVYPDTPASQAGIREDDVILTFDGIDIEDENHLIHLVSLTAINKTVQVLVVRGGQRAPLNVTLSERPQARQAALPKWTPARPMSIRVRRLDDKFAVQIGYSRATRGLLVTQAPADSELRLYDVIEEVARQPVRTADELDAALDKLGPTDDVVLKVRRVVDGDAVSQLVIWRRPADTVLDDLIQD